MQAKVINYELLFYFSPDGAVDLLVECLLEVIVTN